MPEGLINVLSGRQEFLDLTRYLMEIAEKGPERARQLRPAASLFAPLPLPDYERDLDHAGLFRALDHYNEKAAEVTAATVSADGKTVTLAIEDLKSVMSMEIEYDLKASDGSIVKGCLHNPIHHLGE